MVTREKLATAGRLAASIAQEINNPLDAMQQGGRLRLRLREPTPGPDYG